MTTGVRSGTSSSCSCEGDGHERALAPTQVGGITGTGASRMLRNWTISTSDCSAPSYAWEEPRPRTSQQPCREETRTLVPIPGYGMLYFLPPFIFSQSFSAINCCASLSSTSCSQSTSSDVTFSNPGSGFITRRSEVCVRNPMETSLRRTTNPVKESNKGKAGRRARASNCWEGVRVASLDGNSDTTLVGSVALRSWT
jgi:hypothetical protein